MAVSGHQFLRHALRAARGGRTDTATVTLAAAWLRRRPRRPRRARASAHLLQPLHPHHLPPLPHLPRLPHLPPLAWPRCCAQCWGQKRTCSEGRALPASRPRAQLGPPPAPFLSPKTNLGAAGARGTQPAVSGAAARPCRARIRPPPPPGSPRVRLSHPEFGGPRIGPASPRGVVTRFPSLHSR